MTSLNRPTTIAGLQLQNPLMNGAYIHSKTLEDIEILAKSACGGIVVGSISIDTREPNSKGGYWTHKEGFFSLNSFGMPNGGMPYFKNSLPKMVNISHTAGKPLIANLIGFSNEEFGTLVQFAENAGADLVELNFGCPNVWHKGQQERIISYHATLVLSTLRYIAKQGPKIKIAVKISPLPPDILREVAKAIVDSGIIQVVTATNSYPNAYVTTGARVNNKTPDMLVGLAGRALKPISLGVVKQLKQLLPPHMDIIGCGGIGSVNDVKDFLEAGATAVQIATALNNEGPSIFQKILA